MPFIEYFQKSGISEQESYKLSKSVQGWGELKSWLDTRAHISITADARRIPVVPPNISTSWKYNLWKGITRADGKPRPAKGWEKVVIYRQRLALILSVAITAIILMLSNSMLQTQRLSETATYIYLVVYGIMTYFLVSNFCKLMLGTWHTLRGSAGNPWHPAHKACEPRPENRVAIVFPVYHEDIARVSAGIAATWQSIEENYPRLAGNFDVFLLSDSRKVEYYIAEEAAVHHLKEMFPEGRFFYRRRTSNFNAKLGNINDFCRRWGNSYEYMLVMDADSVMDASAIIPLLRMMEGNDQIGILQTNPTPIFRRSIFGRMQQFAGRLYGAVFSYSLQAMLMGNASYIGHNAMIRLKPFLQHCLLPELSGIAPWGGKPLSHDIIESAMMAKAGYEVWFLPELEGSYEEVPANIIAFLIRERRWMQGNLQHLRFLLLNGLRSAHRETLFTGSMGYFAAPLWAIFLVISAYGMISFLEQGVLALQGLKAIELPAMMLLISSVVFLFMPRLLALAVNLQSSRAKLYGGKDKLLWSTALETIFSFFFSPIIMIYVTRFLWLWVKRKGISWGNQQRDDEPLSWDDCFRHFGWVSAIGIFCWVVMVYKTSQISSHQAVVLHTLSGGWMRPSDILLWFFPILSGFAGSVLIVKITSRSSSWLRRRRLFCTPEEISPPQVLDRTLSWEKLFRVLLPDIGKPDDTISYAIRDKKFFIWHRRETRVRPAVASLIMPKIIDRNELTRDELLLALGERRCFEALHQIHAEDLHHS